MRCATIAAVFASLTIANPLASSRSTATTPTGHINHAPNGDPDTYFEGLPIEQLHYSRTSKHVPPGYTNTAPYGGLDTYFAGYDEAKQSNETLKGNEMPIGHLHHIRTSKHAPPGYVNTAPYGGPNTFFAGYDEAKKLNETLNGGGKHLEARTAIGGVYLCDVEFFMGDCLYIVASGGHCHAINKWGYTGSFGPDRGLRCAIFKDGSCGGSTVIRHISYPGSDNMMNFLMQHGDWFDGMEDWDPRSFQCGWI